VPRKASLLGTGFVNVGRKIVAVGRNFAMHAKELGNAVPTKPMLFLKPTTAYALPGQAIEVHPLCQKEGISHEVELGIVIGKKGRDIPEVEAMDYVAGYVVALDMTARELQNEAKKAGAPWSVAKGMDTFCPVSELIPKDLIPDPRRVELWLKVDGQLRQKGNTSDMIFKIPYLISYISTLFTLETGDLILTGTPEGVSAVKAGQTITAGITGVKEISFSVVPRPPARSKL